MGILPASHMVRHEGVRQMVPMKRKRILKTCYIGLLLLLLIFIIAEHERTPIAFTPKDWRLSWGPLFTLYDENGNAFGTMRESHVGPVVILHYSPQKQIAQQNAAADGSQPTGSEANQTSSSAGYRR